MPVSQEYIEQYKMLHSSDPGMFPGQQITFVKDYITNIIKLFECNTMLDYGCGKGYQYTIHNIHADWNVNITLFDIGVDEFSNKPNKTYDLVSSTDMLEHCETADIPDILQELNDYANKVVLVSISTRLAKKTLPDGRNAHLTVQPIEWWMTEIKKVASKPWLILFEKNNAVVGERNFEIKSVNFSDKDLAVVVG